MNCGWLKLHFSNHLFYALMTSWISCRPVMSDLKFTYCIKHNAYTVFLVTDATYFALQDCFSILCIRSCLQTSENTLQNYKTSLKLSLQDYKISAKNMPFSLPHMVSLAAPDAGLGNYNILTSSICPTQQIFLISAQFTFDNLCTKLFSLNIKLIEVDCTFHTFILIFVVILRPAWFFCLSRSQADARMSTSSASDD